MQIVIDIPDEMMDRIVYSEETLIDINEVVKRIAHGTPLPKYHGRLIDADECAENIVAANFELDDKYGEGLHIAYEIVTAENRSKTIIESNRYHKFK